MMEETEIERLESHVSLYREDIVLMIDDSFNPKEIAVVTSKARKYLVENGANYLLIDLTNADRPSPEKKEVLNSWLKSLSPHCKYISFFTGKNVLVNVAIQFVLGNIDIPRSISKTRESAIKKIDLL